MLWLQLQMGRIPQCFSASHSSTVTLTCVDWMEMDSAARTVLKILVVNLPRTTKTSAGQPNALVVRQTTKDLQPKVTFSAC